MEKEIYNDNKLDLTFIINKYLQKDTRDNQIIDVETHNFFIFVDVTVNDNRIYEREEETGQWVYIDGDIEIKFNEVQVTEKETEKRIKYYIDKNYLLFN